MHPIRGAFFDLSLKGVNTMTVRQQKFCDEYLISGNATDAAIKAGYSPKTAKEMASENLAKPNIRAYIDAQLAALHSEKIADATEVLQFLTSIMRGQKTEQVLKLVGEGVQTITDIDVSAKERLKAAELIGKRYALFSDRVDMNGSIPVVIMGDDQLED